MPLPASGISTRAARCDALTSTLIGSCIWPVASAARLRAAMPGGDLRLRHVGRADDDDRRPGPAGERLLDAVVDLHHRQVARQALRARVDRVQAERRDREGDEQRGRRAAPDDRAAQHGADDRAPEARLAVRCARMRARNGIRPRSTRSPSLDSTAGSTVSEPTSAMATTSTVPTPNDAKIVRAHQEHAGHRGHHDEAGEQHGAARRRRGGLQRVGARAPARALLARRGAGRTASSRRRRPGRSAGSPS